MMLKDVDKYESQAHFSYDDYRKKVKKQPNSDIMIFAAVFVVGLLIILGFAKILSPNVDVAISKEGESISTEEENLMRVVDDRLRMLKMEDEGRSIEDEQMFSPELDEKIVLPDFSSKKRITEQREEVKPQEQTEPQKVEKAHTQIEQTEQKAPKPIVQHETTGVAKVVVGYYATEKQAEVAKSIMQDAGLDVTPMVKNLGGYYTLQVGSYSSKERAQQAANNLLRSNFPARVIVE